METFAAHYDRFADLLGDRLSEERRTLFVASSISPTGCRCATIRTASHHHPWRCPYLEFSAAARRRRRYRPHLRLRPVGYQCPTHDLAYMMAMHWYPERRQALERSLLNLYHDGAGRSGVTRYTRGALDRDYRWSVLGTSRKPVWQWTINIPPVIWWNNLERVFGGRGWAARNCWGLSCPGRCGAESALAAHRRISAALLRCATSDPDSIALFGPVACLRSVALVEPIISASGIVQRTKNIISW